MTPQQKIDVGCKLRKEVMVVVVAPVCGAVIDAGCRSPVPLPRACRLTPPPR